MTTTQSRQLAAIMFIDIKGFTKLMEENEAHAGVLRQKMSAGLAKQVGEHHGRIVKQMGDGALCLFNSTIEAVKASIGLQREMQQPPVVPLRIGIHSGDVMLDEMDIYGDGVNVASRVESFAVEGGIFISGKVFEEIKNQKDIQAIPLGKFQFTNIKEPVELFAITNEGLAIPNLKKIQGKGVSAYKKKQRAKMKLVLPGLILLAIIAISYFSIFVPAKSIPKNSVAVIPFKNMSADIENDFFSDGITQDILTQISKISTISVLSPSTTMQLKDNSKSVKELGEELNVGYILEGSVRRALNEIRISAQLVDANTGENVWAETYDREYSKVFEIQSEIAKYIANVLKAKISPAQNASLNKKPTSNLSAYEHYLRGRDLYNQFHRNQIDEAINEFRAAISLDKDYALAWAGLSDAYSQKVKYGFETYWLDSAKTASMKAIGLDPASSEAYKALANYYLYNTDYKQAKPLLIKAISFNPNNAAAIGNLGSCYLLLGQLDSALKWEKQSAILEPKKFVPFYIAGWIYRLVGELNMAELWLQKALELQPYPDVYRELAFTLYAKGKNKEAMALVPAIIRLDSSNAYHYELAGLVTQLNGDQATAVKYYREAFNKKENIIDDPDSYSAVGLAYAMLKGNRKVDAEILLTRSLNAYTNKSIPAANHYDRYVYAAGANALEENTAEALANLKKAYAAHWIDYFFIEATPWYRNLDGNSGYEALIFEMKEKAAAFKKAAKGL